ncbi:TonB-dependent receptor [Parahaliea maris]|nr:TonB-dependent receptor [Parahaliea maris]
MSNVIKSRPLLLVAAVAAINTAYAQEPAANSEAATGIEEIVVTARKRDESIQDTPLSIQAFSDTALEERGIDNMSDLTKFTPGVNFNGGTSRANSDFSIRGMTQVSATGDNRRDLVTVFIDNVPYVGSPAGIGTEDLERIEVIKGPQSALFGRATFGGAISMITTTPGNEFKGRVGFTGATDGDYKINGSIEGPIIEDILAARVTYEGREFDGFYENSLDGSQLGGTDQEYYSGTLSFTPTEDLAFKVRYSNRDDEDTEAATQLSARYTDFNCGPFVNPPPPRLLFGLPDGMTLEQASMFYCGELKTPDVNSLGINSEVPAASEAVLPFSDHKLLLEHELLSAAMDWTFLDGYTLSAIVSDQEQSIRNLSDFERAPEDRYQSYSINEQAQETYELRLTSPADSRLSWMLGVARLDADFNTGGGFIYGTLFGPAAGGPFNPLSLQRNNSTTDSIFGSIGFDITDAINISVEARRQKDEITSGVGAPGEFSIETEATLPRVLARWALSDETNLYFNYAEGNQPTQGYSVYFELTPEEQAVARANGVSASAPEATVNNYEVGLKHRSEDGRWYLNTALYYLEWQDRQVLGGLQIDLNGDGVIELNAAPDGEIFNVVPMSGGDSETMGIEIDGAFSLTSNITLGGSFSYADTEITKSLNDTQMQRVFGKEDAKGQKFPQVPETSAAAFVQYDAQFTDDIDWFARLDATYIGKRYTSLANISWIGPQTRANLRVGLTHESWDLTLFVNNLFDDDTLEWARSQGDSAADPFFFQLSAVEVALPNPRQTGVTLNYRF